MTGRMRIFVAGMIAADPRQGGATWAVLQYVLGLRELGHDVYLVEPIPERSLRPAGCALNGSLNAHYFHDVVERFGLRERAALLREATRETVGLPYERLRTLAKNCDVLFNISGMLTDASILESIPTRVYLDLDPAFNQLWHAHEGIDMRFDAHTHFATVGMNVGRPGCAVPSCGRAWIATLPPIVLSQWRRVPPSEENHGWTTIANWRGYGSIRHDGVLYGQKAHSLRRFVELPFRTSERVQLALAIDPGETNDLAALDANGWQMIDPQRVAGSPDAYRSFIAHSKGELGIAKSGYVESRCGWFSDRSACYLAAGRPVVAQDTGFSGHLPTGEGLLAFRETDEAVDAMTRVAASYSHHSKRAREIAEQYFRSDRVLGALLERVCARAVHVERRPCPSASTHRIDELDVTFGDGRLSRLVEKEVGAAGHHPGPAFLYDPLREARVYERVLPLAPAGTAGRHASTDAKRLVLERVDGLELRNVGSFDAWKQTAAWIGRFHRTFAGPHAERIASDAGLLVYDEEFYRGWLLRATELRPRDRAAREILDAIASIHDAVVQRLARLPRTIIHGEFYPSNVLIHEANDGLRICPVDWELAALGPGLMDVAALSTGWSDGERYALLEAYCAAAATSENPGDLQNDLDCCRLHLALRMLGWSRDWTPPSQHAFDWLGEAARIAGRLGTSSVARR